MKRFLRDTSIFILFFIPFYSISIYLFGRLVPSDFRPNILYNTKMYGTTNNMLKELRSKERIDILIVGASDAYRSYDPRLLGGNGEIIFNAGTSSQTPLQSYILLNDNLDKLKPKLVVYEVSPVCFELDGVESTVDLILNGYSRSSTLKLLFKNPEIQALNSFLFDYVDAVLVKRHIDTFYSVKEKYMGNGYVEMNLSFNKDTTSVVKNWNPKSKQLAYFKKIIDLLKEKNIEFKIINAPSLTDRSYKNSTDFEFVFSESGQYLGYPYLKKFDPVYDFFDASHLNSNGVFKWNRIIKDRISGNK